MKTKFRILFVAFLAIISSVSGWGQFRNTATITANGNFDMSSWIIPTGGTNQRDHVRIVLEEADPSQVFLTSSLTDVTWAPPIGHPTSTKATLMPTLLPGVYGVVGAEGFISPLVNYITRPGLLKGGSQLGERLIEGDNGTFTVNVGDNIVLPLPAFFAGGVGANVLFLDNNPIDMSKSSYTLTATGNYELRTDDGTSAPMNVIKFRLEFQATTVAVSGVTTNPTEKTMTVGEKFTPIATVAPTTATNQNVTWSSNNPTIATVNATTGEIEAKSAGTARITVKTQDGNKEATCDVTVNAANVAVSGVQLAPTTLNKTVGDPSVTLLATVNPSNATNKSVTWESNNTAVATVVNGVVNFSGVGTATITVKTTDGNKTATCSVTVSAANVPVSGVQLAPTTLNKTVGDPSVTLLATVSPSDATNKNVTWESNNTAVATVVNGVVNFPGVGTATITVKTADGNKTATCTVTVTNVTYALTVNNGTGTGNYASGAIVTITANAPPANQQFKNWTSSNGGTFANANSASTTFTMPGGTTTVTANYENIAVQSVKLNAMQKTMSPSENFQLIATITPTNATNKAVTWESDNTNVATVDATGKVTAKAVGNAKITVKTTDGNKSDYCNIIVNATTVSVTGVSLDKTTLSLPVGGIETFIATVTPSNATNKFIVWSTDDATVILVENAKVTGLKNGVATLTAKTQDGNFIATCVITVGSGTPPVIVPVTGVSLKPSTALVVGGTETLTPTITPSNTTDKTVTWKSSDPTVASIGSDGKLTALKAGQTTITVTTTNGGFTATCQVTVSNAIVSVISVSLNKTTMELKEGEAEMLTARINPSTATNQTVSWKSSNIAVATIDENGEVTAHNAGTATITVTTADGNKTATCTVTVKKDDVANETVENSSLKVWSPASGTIQLSGEIMSQVEVYNFSGQVLKNLILNADEAKIDNVPSGKICIVVVRTSSGIISRKVIVK